MSRVKLMVARWPADSESTACARMLCASGGESQDCKFNRPAGRTIGVPRGSRTPVAAVKGRCPGPLDDGDEFSCAGRRILHGPAAVGSGGARRDRTADLYNAIVALSQLSYGPKRREFSDSAAGLSRRHAGPRSAARPVPGTPAPWFRPTQNRSVAVLRRFHPCTPERSGSPSRGTSRLAVRAARDLPATGRLGAPRGSRRPVRCVRRPGPE